jgi:hypothetical protein
MRNIVVLLIASIVTFHAYAEEKFILKPSKGGEISELSNEGDLFVLEVKYPKDILNSAASKGMFGTHAACQLANSKGFTHFASLKISDVSKSKSKIVVGLTNNENDTVSKKWNKYKKSAAIDKVMSYNSTCRGIAMLMK